jgi:hypothetical protein
MVTGIIIMDSGTAIVTAAEVIAAVSAATSMTALLSTNPSIEAVTEEEYKELGRIAENVLQPMEEEQVKVYSPGTPSGESSNQLSVEGEEEQSVQHLDVVSASAHEVSMEPSSLVIVQVNVFILIHILDLKCTL